MGAEALGEIAAGGESDTFGNLAAAQPGSKQAGSLVHACILQVVGGRHSGESLYFPIEAASAEVKLFGQRVNGELLVAHVFLDRFLQGFNELQVMLVESERSVGGIGSGGVEAFDAAHTLIELLT